MKIKFQKNVDMSYYDDLHSRIYYVSDSIQSFKLITKGDKIIGIDIEAENADFNNLEKGINNLIEHEFVKKIFIIPKIRWESKNHCSNFYNNIFDELKSQDEAFEMGDGLVALGQKFMKVFYFFDKEIRNIVFTCFSAKEYQYPTLINYKALENIHYMNSFPHFLMFVTHLHNEISTYYEVQDSELKYDEYAKMTQGVGHCLPPTMCYHTYLQYSGRTIPKEGIVVTSRGKSFRYESKYYKNLERLWDFTIREIVFLGDNDFVFKNNREIFISKILELFDLIGFTGICKLATDPFFVNKDIVDQKTIQMLKESKYEIRLNVDERHTIAVGSSNLHNSHFGNAFNLKFDNGEVIKTSCVGFGLERLTYAFFCQFGMDENKWPKYVQERWDI